MSAMQEQRLKAALMAVIAVGLASGQDAIVKSMSGGYPAYETVMFRGFTSVPLLAFWLWRTAGFSALATPMLGRVLLRGAVLCSAYFAFILSIATMPIANAVSIYFTMPFIVAALAGPMLKESVPAYRWGCMAAAFAGVLVMVRPGASTFEPAALLALYSAIGYAIGQMMGRSLSQQVHPLVIGNWQNLTYLAIALLVYAVVAGSGVHSETHKSLAFLTRPFVWPSTPDLLLLCFMGVLSSIALVAFIHAYKLAASSFVAPFEYTAMIWAVTFGLVFFGDFPDIWNWIGIAIVLAAGLYMTWRDAKVTAAT